MRSNNAEVKNKSSSIDSSINAGLAGANAEVVQRYGSAIKQFFISYGGTDNETGVELFRSLKKIHGYKLNADTKKANINQQAGYAAENKAVARENAEKIINGDKTRVAAVDDIPHAQDDGKGNILGGKKNNELYDIAELDQNGIYIEGTARQLKFVGGNPKECAENILQKKWDKYREADVPVEVPSDFYDGVKKELAEKTSSLKNQLETAEKNGNTQLVEQKKAELERIEKTSKNLRKSKLTKDEAIEARLRPKLSTAKDMLRVANKGGIEAAQNAAMIGGGISFIRNAVSLVKGDKEPEEAVIDVVLDTSSAAGIGYATGFISSAIKGTMQNSTSAYTRALSKTTLPTVVFTTVLETSKTLAKYAKNEIDGTDCFIELGEKGAGMLASAAGAALGQIVIPIPVVGGFIGGMIGHSLASMYYNHLVELLKGVKLAHEERLQIEAECEQARIAIRAYRFEMELVIRNYLSQYTRVFDEAFETITTAFNTEDVDGFIAGANRIVIQLGGKPIFSSKAEFDVLMQDPTPIKI